MGRFQPRFTSEQREQALDAYKRLGSAQAARELPFEVHASTIRRWACDAGLARTKRDRTAAATEAAALTRRYGREQAATEMLAKVGAALDRLDDANPTNFRLLAAGISELVRSSSLLSGSPTDRVELTGEDRVERVKQLRDELAVRREAKSVGAP